MIKHPIRCFRRITTKQPRCFSTNTASDATEFVDPALEWGRNNPTIAEQCLKVPPLPSTPHPSPLETLEDYWSWRKWDFSAAPTPQEQLYSQAIVSHVLSAPLTLASFFHKLPTQASHRWCCVGARAEATLPLEMWKEFLVASTNTNSNKKNDLQLTLDFIGPEIPFAKNLPPETIQNNNSRLSLNWTYQGFLHDYIAKISTKPNWTAFVLLNPGLGHDHLKDGWKRTLDYLLQSKVPILLTAHSELDAQRDGQVLQEQGYSVTSSSNPFASRITYQDPFDANHRVQPNHSVVMIHVES